MKWFNIFDAVTLQFICQMTGNEDGSSLCDPRINAPSTGFIYQEA